MSWNSVRSTLVTAGLAAAVLVSGCGSDERTAEQAMEESSGRELDVDIDDDEVRVETDEGELSVGQSLPEDFPVDEVPLLDGAVMSATAMAGRGWVVNLEVGTEVGEAAEEGKQRLAVAGFEVVSESSTPELVSVFLTNDGYDVSLSTTATESGTQATYTVSAKE
jgi:hypothetical protein